MEWRRAYINYRGLKKLIKRVDGRFKARTSLELSKQPSRSSSKGPLSAAVDGLRRRQRRTSTASGEASDAPIWSPGRSDARSSNGGDRETADRIEERLPQVALDGTGLTLLPSPSESETSLQDPGLQRADSCQANENGGGVSHKGSDPDEAQAQSGGSGVSVADAANVDIEAATKPTDEDRGRRGILHAHSDRPILERFRKASLGEQRDGSKKPGKKANKIARSEEDLDEIVSTTFDAQERIFFEALDSELGRIVKFYVAREADMAKRYEMIARQLQELADHRREYKATHPPAEGWNDLSTRLSHLVAPISQPAQTLRKASVQLKRGSSPARQATTANVSATKGTAADSSADDARPFDEGDRRRSAALSKMLNVSGGTMTDAEDEELRRANRLAALSHDPERYKSARKKLKTAVLEYYRGLEILKNYKILNRTGFAKILKKFEKTTEVRVGDAYYHAKVAPSVLVASETVEKLLKGTEEIYTAYFEHGNRKRALERLRIQTNTAGDQHSSTHHFSSARTGFYLGVATCATVAGIVSAMHDDTPKQIPLWDQLMRAYGAEFLPTLFALLFGVNLAVWHYSRVNAVFIFEWDVRHVLDFHQFFELPAFFMLLLSLAFWVSFLNPFPDAIAPTTWPLVWLIVVTVIMLNPLPILYYRARRWLIVSLLRVFHGGLLSRVEFRDFFLGDELNSISWPISMLWFIGCEYNHNWAYPNQCDPNSTFWTAVLLSVPPFLRFLQCFRRWRDSNYSADLHLVNAGKYSSSILQYFFYINYRYHGSHRTVDLALWCVFGCIYSIYTSVWDITMDWSLLQPRARYPFLRNELVYEQYWPFYYWAIVSNVILRFGWTIYLIPGPASSLLRIFIVALVEMLRRWQWNFLRLENEHLGNVDMYRVSREVPLPYHVRHHEANMDEDDDLEADGKKRRLPAFGSKAMMRLVRRRDEHDEWLPSHYPPGPALDTSATGGTTSREGKGKKAASGDEASETSEADDARQAGRPGSSALAARIRDALVPDRGGMARAGAGLAQMGVAHGEGARDYEPRQGEPAGAESEESDEEDVLPPLQSSSSPSRPSS